MFNSKGTTGTMYVSSWNLFNLKYVFQNIVNFEELNEFKTMLI